MGEKSNLALFDGHFFSQRSFEESFIAPVTEQLSTTYRGGHLQSCDRDAIAGYCGKLHQWPTGSRQMLGSVRHDSLEWGFGDAQWLSYQRSSLDRTVCSDGGDHGEMEEAARAANGESHVGPSAHVPPTSPPLRALRPAMSTKAKQHFISQLRGKRGKAGGVRKYTFNDGEQAILDAGRKEWARGQVKAKELKDRLYNNIKDLYLKENEKRMDDWERDSLRRAVYTFVQLRCKQRSKAARVGTRRLTWREVLYYEKHQEVAKAKKKLMTKTGKPAFHVHQQAITLVSKKLSSADVAKLKVIASAWNLTGPPDDYKVRNALKKLDKRTQEFARDVLTQHGAIYFFMYGSKVRTAASRLEHRSGPTSSVAALLTWKSGSSGMQAGHLPSGTCGPRTFCWGKTEQPLDSGPADLVNGKDPALFQLERNADDQPLLPNLDHKKFDKAAVHMKYSTWVAAVFRAFVSYWYGVGRGVVGRRVKVPWKFLKEHSITDWIAEEFVPEGSERLGAPDKDMNGLEGLLPLLEHWYERQESEQEVQALLAADDPDDFKLPPRPDAVDSGSEEEDVVDNAEVRRAASEGSEAEGVAHTQQKGPQGGGGTRGRGSHEANLGAIAQAERSVQKGGAYAGTAGSNPSAREGHGPRRRRKSGLLGSPADSDHSGVDVAKTKPRRKARGTRIQSDDEAGPRAGAPDAPDAQYRFVEGGSKYEVEENFERDVAGILGEELPPGGNPVDRSPFDDEGVSPGPEIQADGPFSGRGPLLSFASHPPSRRRGATPHWLRRPTSQRTTTATRTATATVDDITRMLDRIEESEEEPEQPRREETPTPESSRLGVGGMRGATKVKATMKTQKSGTTKNAGQGPAEKRQRKAATATQGKRKVRDEDDEVPQASKKVKESAEGVTRKTRAQVGKQTAAPQTLPRLRPRQGSQGPALPPTLPPHMRPQTRPGGTLPVIPLDEHFPLFQSPRPVDPPNGNHGHAWRVLVGVVGSMACVMYLVVASGHPWPWPFRFIPPAPVVEGNALMMSLRWIDIQDAWVYQNAGSGGHHFCPVDGSAGLRQQSHVSAQHWWGIRLASNMTRNSHQLPRAGHFNRFPFLRDRKCHIDEASGHPVVELVPLMGRKLVDVSHRIEILRVGFSTV
ncbi:hypothetical protein FA13DRAFT_1721226 [Coprinellus micaceus]|uniref:Uncharacterized protein n=1 Tax=Coprinellus micaceus TaxID=71717 RepID=A0A4Y7S212_COPMI|nr:hypothetical protein FA13DRAFT_1721226 [Coprinellus micaceus]